LVRAGGGEGRTRRITVVPGGFVERIARLIRFANWEIRASTDDYDDVTGAMAASADGHLVLFVPPGANVPTRLNRVLVPHDGTPATALALDAVEDLAAGSCAEIVVLHVLETRLPAQVGSLPCPRMIDHDGDTWYDWREEFGRRFPHRSLNMLLALQVAAGHSSEMILTAACRLAADLVIVAWGGAMQADRGCTARAVCSAAPCPVLLVVASSRRPAPLALGGRLSGFQL
jgi:nucleotide-binding universal stress UspA family protein